MKKIVYVDDVVKMIREAMPLKYFCGRNIDATFKNMGAVIEKLEDTTEAQLWIPADEREPDTRCIYVTWNDDIPRLASGIMSVKTGEKTVYFAGEVVAILCAALEKATIGMEDLAANKVNSIKYWMPIPKVPE